MHISGKHMYTKQTPVNPTGNPSTKLTLIITLLTIISVLQLLCKSATLKDTVAFIKQNSKNLYSYII